MGEKNTWKWFRVTYTTNYWANTASRAIEYAARDISDDQIAKYATAEEVDKEDL